MILLLKVGQLVHDKVRHFVNLPQRLHVRLLCQCSLASILPVIGHLYLMPCDGLDDESGHVEAEPESEEKGHVPQLPAQVIITVLLYTWLCGLYRSHSSRWWWWLLHVVLMVVDKVVIVECWPMIVFRMMMRIIVVDHFR